MWTWSEPVMVLAMWNGPSGPIDVGGRYWGEWPGNSNNKGKMRIMVNGSELAIEPERVLPYEEYFDRYRAGTLPKEAAGRPWFLEHG